MKKDFILSSLGDKCYDYLKAMSVGDREIRKWQKKHLLLSALVVFVFSIVGIAISKPIVIGVGFAFALFFYYQQLLIIRQKFLVYQFEQNLQFSKFARLIIPYLYHTTDGHGIYQVFSEMLKRTNDETQKPLRALMIEISESPNDIAPYLSFAKKMSDTDFSVTFMSLLYDISQGQTDSEVVHELAKEASHQLMRTIDDIIEFKKKKFNMFSTKLTMTNMVLMLGYLASVILEQINKIGNIGGFHL